MPVTEFHQPPRPIGGGSGRGRLGLAAWIAGLTITVLAGVTGRAPDDGDEFGAWVAQASTPPSARHAPEDRALLVVTLPPPERRETAVLHVRGRAAARVDRVVLVLVRGMSAVGRQTVRPTRDGFFGASFRLAAPEPGGRLTLVAIGIDRHGASLATVRRPVALAELSRDRADPTGGA